MICRSRNGMSWRYHNGRFEHHVGLYRDAPWVTKPKYDQYKEPLVVAQRYSLHAYPRLPTVPYSSNTATELRRRIRQDKQRSLRLSKSVAWMRK